MRQSKKLIRKVYKWSRFFHVYFSTALFALLVWFCATGIVLNHVSWLDGTSQDGQKNIELTEDLKNILNTKTSDEFLQMPPLDLMEVLIKKQYNLKDVSEVVIDNEMKELIFDYKIPGGYATAILDVESANFTLDYRNGSWLSVMGDLHKGRHSGRAWSWVIDMSALLMIVFSLTGLIILYQNQKYRMSGLVATVAGFVSPVVFYLCLVPRLSGV